MAPHRLREYTEIFDTRGREYHEAMLRFPHAREEEFRTILKHASLQDGHIVCDYPSGGGYLEDFITQDINLHLLETSHVFLQCAAEHSRAKRLLVNEGKIPMASESADRFISLAGLHHLADKRPFFREVYRCLKQNGTFTIADAMEGSDVAEFLNGFVHEHSEGGHEGIFLNAAIRTELEECGFRVTFLQPAAYPWKFASMEDMTQYCRLMFGIGRATPSEIEHALRTILGVSEHNGEYHMRWELLFIVAEK